MGADELHTLLNIYLNPVYEEESSIGENLEEAGIDVESFIEEITFNLLKAEAERRLEEGEKFKNVYLTLLKTGKQEELKGELTGELSFGFRNQTGELTEAEQAELEEDRKKLALIKKITDANERDGKS